MENNNVGKGRPGTPIPTCLPFSYEPEDRYTTQLADALSSSRPTPAPASPDSPPALMPLHDSIPALESPSRRRSESDRAFETRMISLLRDTEPVVAIRRERHPAPGESGGSNGRYIPRNATTTAGAAVSVEFLPIPTQRIRFLDEEDDEDDDEDSEDDIIDPTGRLSLLSIHDIQLAADRNTFMAYSCAAMEPEPPSPPPAPVVPKICSTAALQTILSDSYAQATKRGQGGSETPKQLAQDGTAPLKKEEGASKPTPYQSNLFVQACNKSNAKAGQENETQKQPIVVANRVQTEELGETNTRKINFKDFTDEEIREFSGKLEKCNELLKKGLPTETSSAEVIDYLVNLFSLLKRSFPLIDLPVPVGSCGSPGSPDSVEDTEGATSVHIEAGTSIEIKCNDKEETISEPKPYAVSKELLEHIGNLIGDWKCFFQTTSTGYGSTSGSSRRCLVREKLKPITELIILQGHDKTTDFSLSVQFRPIKLVADVITCIILDLIDGTFGEVLNLVVGIRHMLLSDQLYKKKEFALVYAYIVQSLRVLVKGVNVKGPQPTDRNEFPSDDSWSQELLRNRFLLWFYIEKHMLPSTETWVDEAHDLILNEVNDVQWLVAMADALRERRLNSPFPKQVTSLEKQLIKNALALEPENPFAILALLGVLADSKGRLSKDFEGKCQYLLVKYNSCVEIKLRVAKFFLKKGRNINIGMRCVMEALFLNPRNADANHMLGNHLIRSTKGIKDVAKLMDVYGKAFTADLGNFITTFEYFKLSLGRTLALGGFFPIDKSRRIRMLQNCAAGLATDSNPYVDSHPFLEMMNIIIRSSSASAWKPYEVAQLKFLRVIAFYLREDHHSALAELASIYKYNQVVCMILSIDDIAARYLWDKTRINGKNFVNWLLSEYEELITMECELRETIEYSDSDEFSEPEDDDENLVPGTTWDASNSNLGIKFAPLKVMLAYLIRIIS